MKALALRILACIKRRFADWQPFIVTLLIFAVIYQQHRTTQRIHEATARALFVHGCAIRVLKCNQARVLNEPCNPLTEAERRRLADILADAQGDNYGR